MNTTTLTPSKAALVRDLLKLWDASYHNNPCRHGCECERCRAMETAGNHVAAIWDSLAAKVGGGE